MTNKEHVKILEQGVEAWNEWREEYPDIRPNLFEADLAHHQLAKANFADADLGSANLSGTDLSAANLIYARLVLANLENANLNSANLGGADLLMTNLSNASLNGANLLLAKFRTTNLAGARLTDTRVHRTTFADMDLSNVQGLETVRHDGPSMIGIETFYKSKGNIPEVFLRGCGVPEDFITYAHFLVINPIEYYSCFISHSSKDKKFVDRLHADLQAKNIRCWYAPEDLKIGDKFRIRIEESIRIYDKVMIVLSENSIRSAWVEEEVEAALERERQHPGSTVLFPIRLDGTVMTTNQPWAASLRRIRHIGDFSRWKNHDSYQKAFDRLLRDLKSESKAAPSAGGAARS
jgi:hypothetical protein